MRRLRRSLINEEIQDIIEQLHVNDRTAYLGNAEPEKPVKEIEKLINIGYKAVPSLIKELQNYGKGGTAYYYAEYVIEALGEIGDPRSLEELVKMMDIDFDIEIHEKAVLAISKLGDISISYYLDKVNQTKSSEIIFDALWVFLHIKEKNTDVLGFAKQILQDNKEYDLKVSAVEVIGQMVTRRKLPR